ncbi:MAG: NAD(P)H-hydrate dehydratase [Ilumatobacteraceae bacterium]|nr:NAD(P)H-hydrate dehydratase [Ilumatobacteraceae bacterium]NQW59616.1 NAD(P)H-hydrate dehydratase [bacterium]
MEAVFTPEQMRYIDAHSAVDVAVFIRQAGFAVAQVALRMLGGSYGKHVVVLAGKGNNGEDGRVASEFLRTRGIKVSLFASNEIPPQLPECDLVIDAVYGTGLRGEFFAPITNAPVLAVDIPSGVDAITGECRGIPFVAQQTVTFGALKPGIVLQPGRTHAGVVTVASLDLPLNLGQHVDEKTMNVVTRGDIEQWIPSRAPTTHKWKSGVRAIAGSRTMMGAAQLSCAAAYKAGAGIVHLSSVGGVPETIAPLEVVYRPVSELHWADQCLSDIERFASALIGPGLGRGDELVDEVFHFVSHCSVPLVIDGDGLQILASSRDGQRRNMTNFFAQRTAETVLTPHDGEFSALTGERPSADRIADTRKAAATLKAVVLLKGSTTVVAEPSGNVFCITNGDARLATAGSGDVLTGVIAALLAMGLNAFHAAAAGAFIHGNALERLPEYGVVASDIVQEIQVGGYGCI